VIGATLRTLGRQTAVYSFGDLLVKSLAFLLIPVLTRVWAHDGPEMGTYGLLHLAESVSYICFNLGLATAVIKVLADYRQSRSRASVLFTTLVLLSTLSLGLLVLGWIAAPHVAAPLFGPAIDPLDGTRFLRLTLLATWFSTFRFVTLSMLRVEERPWLYTLLNILNFLVYVSVAIWLVVFENQGVLGIVYANLTAGVVMLAVSLGLLQARAHRPFSMAKARALLGFGVPLLPNGLALWALALLDRWLLRVLSPTPEIGLALTGQYDVAYRFGMIVSFLLVVPLRTAWVPTLFRIGDHEEAPDLYGRLITYVLALGGGIALALGVLSREILEVVTRPEWIAAAAPLPLIACAYLAYGVSQVADAGILARSRTTLYPLVTITSVTVNVSLCVLLIPDHGMMGAAWATLAAYVWHALLIARVSHSIVPVQVEWKRIGIVAVAGAAIWIMAGQVPELALLPRIGVKTAIVLLYPLVLWVLGFFSAEERAALQRLRSTYREPGGSDGAPEPEEPMAEPDTARQPEAPAADDRVPSGTHEEDDSR